MASQGRVHPNCSANNEAIGGSARSQQRSMQMQQQQAAVQQLQVVQAQLTTVPVGQVLVGHQAVAAAAQHVNKAREDSQNYMLQQLQKKELQRASAGASAASQGGALKCGHCDYTCDHKDIMLGHLGAHADVLPFICSKCGLANKWHHTAWIHLQQVDIYTYTFVCSQTPVVVVIVIVFIFVHQSLRCLLYEN